MDITIKIDETLLTQVAQQAVRQMYRTADGRELSYAGEGYRAIHQQAVQWARQQDYAPLIAEIAPAIIRAELGEAVKEAVKKAVKQAVKHAQVDGTIAALIAEEQT